jgi:tetratricopeptide (TPR) repeat protein
VDAILDGTLQVAGSRIRVSLNLIETSKAISLWTQAFDVPLSDIFEVEDEVARQVTRQLRLQLDEGQSRLRRHSTRNAEAYEHYLKGLYSSEARGVSGSGRVSIEVAIARFRKAVELDPSYAQAWARLASCYYQLVNFYQPDPNLAEEARNAADRAYALDPDLPELLVFRAQILWSWNGHYRIEEAIRELRRPAGNNSSEVRALLGVLYHHAGLHRQAIAELKRALEIDPANSLYLDRLAEGYVWAGRYEDARAAYERAFAFESETKGSLVFSAIPFLYVRQFDEARRRLESAQALGQDRAASAYLALLAALEGRFQEAEGAIPPDIHEMEKFRNVHHVSYAFASVFALQGKSAEAVRWLRKTAETGMPDYPMFARDPNLSRIHTSTEFVQFMAELKPRYETIEREFR